MRYLPNGVVNVGGPDEPIHWHKTKYGDRRSGSPSCSAFRLVNRVVLVGCTKDQIKDSPEYDPDRYDDEYRTRLGDYYGRYSS
jgi:hypothetical protein